MKINPRLKLEIIRNDRNVYTIITIKKSRFLSKLQAIPESEVKLYKLSVSYGTITDSQEKKVIAKNKGEYTTLNDLLFAFRIFTDPKEILAIRNPNKERVSL